MPLQFFYPRLGKILNAIDVYKRQGLIISVLGFNDTGTALMLSIFALQDSFGTACNVTGDGAIALMVTGIFDRVPKDPKEIEE